MTPRSEMSDTFQGLVELSSRWYWSEIEEQTFFRDMRKTFFRDLLQADSLRNEGLLNGMYLVYYHDFLWLACACAANNNVEKH